MFVTNFLNLKDVLKNILLAIEKEKLQKKISYFSVQLGHHLIVLKILKIEGKYFNQLIKKFLNAK